MSRIFSLMFTDTITAILFSQVVSLLRLKHNMKAEVCQLTGCDYIVSNRMAVKRKTASGNLVVVSTFCENHLRISKGSGTLWNVTKKICAKKTLWNLSAGHVLSFPEAIRCCTREFIWEHWRCIFSCLTICFLSGWHGVLPTRKRCYFTVKSN